MKKQIYYLLISSLIIPTSVFAEATTTPTSTTNSILAPAQTLPVLPKIITQIKDAKMQLAPITLNYTLTPKYKTVTTTVKKKKVKKQVLDHYEVTSKDIVLAILDPATGTIVTAKGTQTGKSMDFSKSGYDIKLATFNGVNSRFTINTPANGVVVASKYLIVGTDSGSKDAITKDLEEAVYVPYSKDLDTPEVQKYGGAYLDSTIQSVAQQLGNIPSVSQPGMTITQAIKPSLVKALVYAEHMDTTEFLYNPDTQSLINKVNTLFAANEGDTYKYSGSSAGALGIAQFISSTYKSLASRHPEVALNPDFESGMADHVNAVKAMYLLLDDYIAAVEVKAAGSYMSGSLFDYGAAAYNGGVSRVAKAISTFGHDWNQDQSATINNLQQQVNSLASQVSSLKKKIKATKTSKEKASLNAQLSSANSNLITAKSQLDSVQSSALRNETVNYLQKMYKLIQVFNDQQT